MLTIIAHILVVVCLLWTVCIAMPLLVAGKNIQFTVNAQFYLLKLLRVLLSYA